MKKKRPAWESTLKSTDTEEFLDMCFYRPLGYRWALLFRRLAVSPNQVTVAAIMIGITAGFCFYFTDLWINWLGVFLLIWANTFDSADGQLARMTHKQTELGRILDGVCGDCWFVAIYFAIVFRLWPEWNWPIVLLGLVAGHGHLKQAAMA
ncbi:MAG: CDP-alcohol phosphatidyltransferase family protein, partial [Dysgonamonadaceae bacterium]|nr:CDP-alcohol phosphatidyltransferase family protein [Dysgonamonadaceae bacterium]